MNRDDRWRLQTTRTRPQLRSGRTDWYRVANKAERTAELVIFDEIGFFGVSAGELIDELDRLAVDSLTVRLNSPGGEVFDGVAIFNALKDMNAEVTVIVEGLAASAASIIAMAGDEIVMNRGAQMMIHQASGVAVGNADVMAQMSELLAKLDRELAAIYTVRAGRTVDEWLGLMTAETWFSASEAVEFGLADRAVTDSEPDDGPTAASFDLSIFRASSREDAGPPGLQPEPEPEPEPVDTTEPEPVTAVSALVNRLKGNTDAS